MFLARLSSNDNNSRVEVYFLVSSKLGSRTATLQGSMVVAELTQDNNMTVRRRDCAGCGWEEARSERPR